MRKALLIVLGLILIGVLSYFCFINKAPTIRDNLISKTASIYKDKNIVGVEVNIEEKNLTMSRILTLTGSVLTKKERVDAVVIAESIVGVIAVNNQITIKPTPSPVFVKNTGDSDQNSTLVAVEETTSSGVVPTTVVKKAVVVIEKAIEVKVTSSQTSLPISTVKPVETIEVPIAIKTVNVPIPVQVVSVPVAIKVEDKSKKIEVNTKGVE